MSLPEDGLDRLDGLDRQAGLPLDPAPGAAGTSAAPARALLLAHVHDLGARRPVAARVAALAADESTGARELARVLAADVTLAARVVGLANSAAYGMPGRVRTVAFAVTTVGAEAVRALAVAAASGIDGGAGTPQDFWPRCRLTATACGELAGTFGLPGAEAFCLGLLSSLGQAVLWQHDPQGCAELVGAQDGVPGRAGLAAAEQARYGVRHTELSAAAVAAFGFPAELAEALRDVDDPSCDAPGPWGACLRSALEVARRTAVPEQPRADLAELSGGVLTELEAAALELRVAQALAESAW